AFDDGSEVVVAAISGTAGVGKTALAVHWAHAVADRFPDGQIYVNLRGFDPAGAVVTPAEAIRGFLDALGAPPERVPADLDRQSALYRTLLAGRRMLILLDNARDTGHARPLLPGTAGCLVLVTSRHLLSGLIADGAHPIELDLLSTAEARQLLSRRLGADRVAAESAAVDKIIARCVRLPLALAVATARAATRARWGLASLAAELDDVRRRLDTLVGDDPATDLRAVFSWSYRCLSPAAARLFRLLSLHPGPDTSGPAAASLAAVPLAELLPAVAELADAHLLVEHQPGRYACHDLLRAYAAEQVEATETGDVRDAAVGRMLDHYLHTAHAGNQLMNRARERLTVAAVGPGVVPEQLTEAEQARDWFRAEHRVLLGAVEQAAATGHDVHAWQLAWTLWTFLEWRGHWHEWATTGRTALDAAQRLADPVAEATAHRFLANAATRLGRFDDARTHLRHALDLYRRVGDQSGQARVHVNISSLWERQGRHPEALHHNRQALDLFRTTGYKPGLAVVLNNIGWLYAHLGDHQQSLEHCREAVVLQQALGNQHGEASAWDSLGYARHRLGQYGEALACFHRATEMYRDIGDHYRVADTLVHLADTHLAMGDPQAAGDARREALSLLDSLNHPGAAELRARLMPPTPPRQRRG
ncbi:MAG TPA: tetratricopeptide repeat protein, partial [Catenuloplanes sp.]